MSEQGTNFKLTQIKALNVDPQHIMVKTDEEHFLISWDSITHAFLLTLTNKYSKKRPVFVMICKHEEQTLYLSLDSYLIHEMRMVINGKILMASLLTKSNISPFDKTFAEAIVHITNHFTWTYIDAPLKEYLQSGKMAFPDFSDEKDIEQYFSSLENKPVRGKEQQQLEDSIKDIKTLSGPITSREEWTKGYVIDNRYEIYDILYGGMGVVYLVKDSERSKSYALKTFQDQYLYNTQVCSQFIKEAEIWTKLGKHRNIVQAERVIIREGRPYIFLEYIDGPELETVINEKELNFAEALDYSLQFCEGMNYATSRMHLVHRDIKPANCFIDKENVLKISDFGLGKIAYTPGLETDVNSKDVKGKDILASAAMVGTIPYMAPELFSDMTMASTKTDIYAFGVMMYEMFTGTNPFHDEDPTEVIDRHLSLEPPNPSELKGSVPKDINNIIKKCVAKEQSSRYSMFSEIQADLSEIYRKHTGREIKLEDSAAEEASTEEDWIKKGLSLANLRQYSDAIKAYDEAIKLNPRTPALVHKGVALSNDGNHEKALKIFDEFISLHPDYWKAWYYKGDTLRASKQFAEAMTSFKRAAELSPENAEIIAKIAQVTTESGNPADALVYYEEALEINNKIPDIWYHYGVSLMKTNKFESAQEAFTEATELNPRFREAWYYRGKAFLSLGFHQEAIKAFNISLSIDPHYKRSLLGIGDSYFEIKNINKAEEYYDLVLKKMNPPAEAIIGKMRVLSLYGRGETAIDLAQSFLSGAPWSVSVKEELAKVFLETHNYSECILRCQELITSNKESEQVHQFLNCALNRTKYLKELKNEISQLDQIDYDFATTDLNTILAITCDIEDAKKNLSKLIDKSPELELKVNYLICILEKISGNEEEAKKLFELMKHNHPRAPQTQELEKRFFSKSKDKNIVSILRLKKDKKSSEDMMIDGLIKMLQGNKSEAFTTLQSAYLSNKTLVSTLFFCGKILKEQGEILKSKAMFEAFIRVFPKSVGYYKDQIESNSVNGDLAFIEKCHRQMISLLPYFPSLWISYISFLQASGQREKAEATSHLLLNEYMEQLKEEPENLLRLKGALMIILNQPDRSTRIFEKLCAENPQDITSMGMLAYSLRKTGKAPLAEKLLSTAENLTDEEELFITIQKAAAIEDMGNPEQAVNYLENGKFSSDPVSIIKASEILLRSGKNDEALAKTNIISQEYPLSASVNAIKRMVAINKGEHITLPPQETFKNNNIDLLKNRGIELYLNKHYIEASEIFQKLVSINRLDPEAHFLDGLVFYSTAKYDLAMEKFNEAAKICYTSPALWSTMGAASCHNGNKQKAMSFFTQALNINSTDPETIVNFSTFLIENGSLLDAQQYAEKALRIDNTYPPAWIARGRCLKIYGNLDDALTNAESALLLDPDDLHAWLLKGSIQIELEDTQGALHTLRKASELNNLEASIWYNLGLITLLQDKSEAALSYAYKAVKRNPMMFEILNLYAVCNLKIGNKDKYTDLMKRLEELDIAKFQKMKKLQSLRNSLTATLKPLDTTSDPFKISIPKGRYFPAIFNFMSCKPIIEK